MNSTLNKKRRVTGAKKLEFIEENAGELLKVLQQKDQLEQEVLLEVLGVTAGFCVGQRHKVECCENRPCCYRELFPQEGKSRMAGLWSKNVVSQEMKKLDPCLQRRDPDEPCGLLNMGQTCYVNGALQILYAIEEFRTGVLRQKPLEGEQVLAELQLLFTSMETSTGKCSDPTALVEVLQICPRTQEDGWEFLKSLLERLPVSIRQLLKGSLCYETVCYKCNTQRDGHDRLEDFLEILVHIENTTNLQEAIQALLEGDDVEVWCDVCSCVCSSRRRVRLVQLPQILLFSLMRAAFSATGTEVKDRRDFSIPYSLALDLPDSNQDQKFFLKGVLQHQGNKSTKGHYVAQVLHGNQWWEFNDEDVEQLNASSSRRTLQNKPSTRNPTTAINSDSASAHEFKSRDAYMLVYCMEPQYEDGAKDEGSKQQEENQNNNMSGVSHESISEDAVQTSLDDYEAEFVLDPPRKKRRLAEEENEKDHVAQLRQKVSQQNMDRQQHEERINGLQEYIDSRRAECRQWQDSFSFSKGDCGKQICEVIFMPSKWLWSWANEVQKPSQIDTFEFRCQHGMLDPVKLKQSSKRVCKEFWDAMVTKWGLRDGSPLLNLDFICQQCVMDWCRTYCPEQSEQTTSQEVLQNSDKFNDDASSFPENGSTHTIPAKTFPVPVKCSSENQQQLDGTILIDQSDTESTPCKIQVKSNKHLLGGRGQDTDNCKQNQVCDTHEVNGQGSTKNVGVNINIGGSDNSQLQQLSKCNQDLEKVQMDSSRRKFRKDGSFSQNQTQKVEVNQEVRLAAGIVARSPVVIDLLESSDFERLDCSKGYRTD